MLQERLTKAVEKTEVTHRPTNGGVAVKAVAGVHVHVVVGLVEGVVVGNRVAPVTSGSDPPQRNHLTPLAMIAIPP